MRKALLYCIISFVCIFTLNSQDRPAILVRPEDGKDYIPLKMSDLDISVEVTGNLAVTTMEITFYNDLNRVLEGQFYFPLSEGQTVSRFALDVNGKIREGVIVEKEKGRKVYESTIRKKIDPGLLEWTKGNSFKARIYPVPAKGHKRLIIAYEQELKQEADGFLYLLPLAFEQAVDTFSLKVEVFKQIVQPEFTSSNELVNLSFKKIRESYSAEMKEKKYLANKQLAFLIPKTKDYQQVSIEKRNGRAYFYAHLCPEIIRGTKKLPGKICLAWDASMSGGKKDMEREFALLEKYFNQCVNVDVELVIFRDDVEEKSKVFPVKKGDWRALKSELENIPFDGGTQLGCLDFTKYSCDEVILSTDGISTFGANEIKLSFAPVIVINSCLTARHSYLNYIARKTSGVYINLTTLSIDDAMRLLCNQPYSFLKAEYKKDEITEVYPAIPAMVIKDFSIVGILTSKRAEIILHFGIGNKTMHTEKIILDAAVNVSDSGLIPRVWAQKKITELDMQYEKNREEIIRMGREYSIVTRDTSLIVLDGIEDYVEHGIVPPEELQSDYFRIIHQQEKDIKQKEKDHIEEVVQKFTELKNWWNTTFSWDPPKVMEQQKKEAFEEEERSMRDEDHSYYDSMDDGLTAGNDETVIEEPRPVEPDKTEKGEGSIELAKWDPDTPYLKELKKTKDKDMYAVYLKLKKDYLQSSAFYLDVADFFIEQNKEDLALRILSNIAEMELENHQLLRILGHRLMQLKYHKLAIFVFEQVFAIRQEEPQSFRDLGLVYEKDRRYQKAVDFLYEVVRRGWDDRFPDIELIALAEMNSIIARQPNINTSKIDKRLLKNLPVDIRVVLDWDADNTDIDIWVLNPNGEKCYYSNPLTHLGGHMSRDFTQGYGPEEYMLKKAKPGNYIIQVNYYGNSQQILAGATTIQVRLILNFGSGNEAVKEITLRLKDQKEVITVGEFRIKVKDGKVRF